jgi:signal transduction histidine kinase
MRVQWLALLLTGALCAVASFGLTWRYVNEQRDHTLEQVAQSVIRHGLESDDGSPPDVPDKGQFTSQIWAEDGTLAYPTDSAPDKQGPPRQQPGWHHVDWQHTIWHVYTVLQDGLTIQVSQPSETRSQAFWQIAPDLLAALAVLTIVLYGLLHLAANWSLRPVSELREQLNRHDPLAGHDQLTQRPWPEDLLPLVNTLHTLFARLSDARLAQQHLVARAAHEFRTPLAALKIHAQLLGRSADPSHDERHRAHVLHAIDRMTRLVDQLLKLAEFDAIPEEAPPQRFDVAAWLAPSVQVWHTLAQARGLGLQLDVPEGAQLLGHPQALKAMLDNVVHNALCHSGSTADITVALSTDDTGATWRVIDHGTGIPPEQRNRVGQGFVSMAGVHSEGSGLGLAIACKVAALHGGELTLADTPGGGLTVCIRLSFPLSA